MSAKKLRKSNCQTTEALGIIFPGPTFEYTYSELVKAAKEAYSKVMGITIGNNAISALIPFLKDRHLIIQDMGKQGKPYRYDSTSKW